MPLGCVAASPAVCGSLSTVGNVQCVGPASVHGPTCVAGCAAEREVVGLVVVVFVEEEGVVVGLCAGGGADVLVEAAMNKIGDVNVEAEYNCFLQT